MFLAKSKQFRRPIFLQEVCDPGENHFWRHLHDQGKNNHGSSKKIPQVTNTSRLGAAVERTVSRFRELKVDEHERPERSVAAQEILDEFQKKQQEKLQHSKHVSFQPVSSKRPPNISSASEPTARQVERPQTLVSTPQSRITPIETFAECRKRKIDSQAAEVIGDAPHQRERPIAPNPQTATVEHSRHLQSVPYPRTSPPLPNPEKKQKMSDVSGPNPSSVVPIEPVAAAPEEEKPAVKEKAKRVRKPKNPESEKSRRPFLSRDKYAESMRAPDLSTDLGKATAAVLSKRKLEPFEPEFFNSKDSSPLVKARFERLSRAIRREMLKARKKVSDAAAPVAPSPPSAENSSVPVSVA